MKLFDCFSGIGGFRSAAKLVFKDSLECVGHCEIDKYAQISYKAMHEVDESKEFCLTDITNVTRSYSGGLLQPKKIQEQLTKEVLKTEVFCAGFPCQPHSLMGNRQGGNDSRGSLSDDMIALIRAINPRNIILENVRAIKSVNNGKYFEKLIQTIKKSYNVSWIEINAADYGVPQVRRRIFIVGTKNKTIQLNPTKISIENAYYPSTWHLLEKTVDKKYYLSEKIKRTILADSHKGYSRKAEINRILARPLTRTMHKMHRASQDNYFSDSFIHGEFDIKQHIVKESTRGRNKIRRLTPREAFRIQSFSETEINRALSTGISDTQLYMQTGNSVPVLLAKAIMEEIS